MTAKEKMAKTDSTKEGYSALLAAAEAVDYTPEDERRINRKIDLHLVPVLTILYLMSYLDRGNMGNAAIIGLKEDLGLTPLQYNLCLTLFFIPYSLFEVPSNLMLKVLRPSRWIGLMMLVWGTVATLMGLVHNFSGLMAARFFLAVGEAGFFPAAAYLLTTWYRRHEIQMRMGVFYSVGALSGAVSGLLAYLINMMHGVGGLQGWRWLFILEGLLTVLLATATPFMLPDSPESCRFLTDAEKKIVAHRLRMDAGTSSGETGSTEQTFKWKYVKAAFADWKVWAVVVIYWGSAIPIYGFIYTLPTVIVQLGYTAQYAQLMTIPIYVAAVLAILVTAYLADRAASRSMFVIIPLIIGGIGLVGLLAIPKGPYPGALLGMLFLVAMGLYSIVCGTVAWTGNNCAGPWKRATGMALMISVGNLGGVAGTNIYLAKEAPWYWTGYGVSLAVVVCSTTAAVLLRWKLKKINAQRDAMSIEEVTARYTDEELNEMGDDSPLFRYTT